MRSRNPLFYKPQRSGGILKMKKTVQTIAALIFSFAFVLLLGELNYAVEENTIAGLGWIIGSSIICGVSLLVMVKGEER